MVLYLIYNNVLTYTLLRELRRRDKYSLPPAGIVMVCNLGHRAKVPNSGIHLASYAFLCMAGWNGQLERLVVVVIDVVAALAYGP